MFCWNINVSGKVRLAHKQTPPLKEEAVKRDSVKAVCQENCFAALLDKVYHISVNSRDVNVKGVQKK